MCFEACNAEGGENRGRHHHGGERVFRSGSGNKEEEQREDEGDDGQENMRTVNHAVPGVDRVKREGPDRAEIPDDIAGHPEPGSGARERKAGSLNPGE